MTNCVKIPTDAYKGHCVLCKDVLSFVFQTFSSFVFWLLCFVSCVVGRTCSPTPLLAICAIKNVYTNIPFPCSSWWRFIVHTSGNTKYERLKTKVKPRPTFKRC